MKQGEGARPVWLVNLRMMILDANHNLSGKIQTQIHHTKRWQRWSTDLPTCQGWASMTMCYYKRCWLHPFGFYCSKWKTPSMCNHICCQGIEGWVENWLWPLCRADWTRRRHWSKYGWGESIASRTRVYFQREMLTMLLLLLRQWKHNRKSPPINAWSSWWHTGIWSDNWPESISAAGRSRQ